METNNMDKIIHDARGNSIFLPGITPNDVMDYYKGFAETYEQSVHAREYKGPSLGAEEIRTYFPTPRDIKILDCGAGTGLVGEKLYRHGFTHLDAVDPNMKMLAKLEKKRLYKKVICDVLGANRLPFDDDYYDGVTVIGVIMAGGASETCFPELIRVVKPGGIIVITTREMTTEIDPYLKKHLEPEMQRLHDNGSWQWLKREDVPNYVGGLNGVLFVFKVL